METDQVLTEATPYGPFLPVHDSLVLFGSAMGLGYVDHKTTELVYPAQMGIKNVGDIRESILDDNGILWLAGDKGIAKSLQPIIQTEIRQKRPVITRIYRNDEPVILNEQYDLKFDQHTREITFEFALVNPIDPSSVNYRWRLEGFDREWKMTNNSRTAQYMNLPGGNYSLLFESHQPNGSWVSGRALPISIQKPFYAQPLFLVLVLLGFGLLIFGIIRVTAHITRREESIKLRYERKLIEAELTALRSQMNPHFIFNSLNSIYDFILSNDTEHAAEYLVKFSKLMRIVLAQSKQTLVPLYDELMVIELYLELEQIRFNRKFDYSISIDPTLRGKDPSCPTYADSTIS